MPCYYKINPDRDKKSIELELKNLTHRICDLLTRLEEAGLHFHIVNDPELRTWWHRHKGLDARHIEIEIREARYAKLRESAKKKLSAEERRAFGIE